MTTTPPPDDAFEKLVKEHLDFVYSAALRQVRDTHLAEDVTQAVFILLLRKRDSIKPSSLPGWLFNTTRYAARNAMKMHNRRSIHERRAAQAQPTSASQPEWADLSDDLDQAVSTLARGEREVILMQYFQGRSLTEAAALLGISHDTARKRSSRAIERLRTFFGGRGMSISATAIGTMIASNSIQAAPASLAGAVLTAAGGTAGASTLAIVKGVITMKIIFGMKIAAAVAVVVLASTAIIVSAQRATTQAKAPTSAPAARPATQQAFLSAPNLENIQTLHMRYTETGPGVSTPQDVYLDSEKGLAAYKRYPDASIGTFDDGTHQWNFKTGGAVVGQTASTSSKLMQRAQLLGQLALISQLGPVADPSKDVEIGGVACRYFFLAGNPNPERKTEIWVDHENRMRRHRVDAAGRITITDFEYNPTLDASIFPQFDPTKVRIIQPQAMLESEYPLTGAIYTREAAGMLFAVHSARQDDTGLYHIICSTRLSESSKSKLGPSGGGNYFGTAMLTTELGDGNRIVEQVPAYPEQIATFQTSGIEVRYALIVLNAKRGALPGQCEFAVRCMAGGELDRLLKSESLPTMADFKVSLEVPPRAGLTSLDFIKEAHAKASQFEGAFEAKVAEITFSEKGTGGMLNPRRASELPLGQFTANVMQRVERRLQAK